jgi:rhodanese-related sulfurtransferase
MHDGERLRIGNLELVALETPGHTPESLSWLVVENGVPVKVLTGDTLFIGDVGRPDLAGGRGYSSGQMAEMLYDSLHGKLLPLPDAVEVWPAHGAGSACGRNISKETSSTIGAQRLTNYALAPMTRDAFVAMMTTDLPEAPAYFPRDAELNRAGARALADLPVSPLAPPELARALAEGTVALDVRTAAAFGEQHIAGAINIGLDGQFASWCGSLLPFDGRIAIVAENDERAREAVLRLARVGLENVAGWLDGGMPAWLREGLPVAGLAQLAPSSLREQLGHVNVIDVRAPQEYAGGHVPGATNVPLDQLARRSNEIERAPLAVICAGGYRSSAAASLLARHGFSVVNVAGGTAAWVKEGFATES